MEECNHNEIESPPMEEEIEVLSIAEALLQLSTNFVPHVPTHADIATQVCSGDLESRVLLKIEKLTGNEINSLTGIPSKEMILLISSHVEEELALCPKRNLKVIERVLLTMMRIKLNITFAVLAILFGCTATTCSTIFIETVCALANTLQGTITFSSKEEIISNLPKCFRHFPKVRIVLDCTEIPVATPKCLKCRIATYSHYKGGHTIKYLVGLSPGGIITFLSKGYGGRTSDKIITEQSGIVEMLEPFVDTVMVDKGFLIDDICNDSFIEIVRPPFLKSSARQLSKGEVKSCRKISSSRVHVERMNQRIKLFKLLQVGKIPWSICGLTDKIMIIASGISNLSAGILADDKY